MMTQNDSWWISSFSVHIEESIIKNNYSLMLEATKYFVLVLFSMLTRSI